MRHRQVSAAPWIVPALLIAALAQAAQTGTVGTTAVHMVLDFCGEVVGTDPATFEQRLTALPDFNVGAPRVAASPSVQNMVGKLLTIGADTPYHRLTLKEPVGNPPAFGALRTDLKSCGVMVLSDSDAPAALRARMTSDPAWAEIMSTPDMPAWQRKKDNDQVTTLIMLASVGTTIVSVESLYPAMPTRAKFAEFAAKLVGPCVKLVLSDEGPEAAGFAAPFEFKSEKDSEGNFTMLADDAAIPVVRTKLVVGPFKKNWICAAELQLRGLPVKPYSDGIADAFRATPGVTARQDEKGKYWSIVDPATHRTATLLRLNGKDVLYVTIRRE